MLTNTQYLDKQYINLFSSKLPLFKWKSSNLANFRCPVCGDSEKKKYKARGYFYERKGTYSFFCHNCHTSMSLQNFLKKFDNQLYREYLLEKFRGENTFSEEVLEKNKKTDEIIKINLPSVESLSPISPARKYIGSRLIPPEYYSRLFYTDKFKEFVDQITPAYKDRNLPNDERIVIPFFYEEDKFSYLTARALYPKSDKDRYMAIKLNNNSQKIFGLDRFEKNYKAYIVEGPIDSMFLPNSLAKGDADLTSSLLGYLDPEKTTFIMDNEFRNKAIVGMMEEVIESGYNLFIWPEYIQAKDINGWILDGFTQSEIIAIINQNTYRGLEAKLKLSNRRKC